MVKAHWVCTASLSKKSTSFKTINVKSDLGVGPSVGQTLLAISDSGKGCDQGASEPHNRQ